MSNPNSQKIDEEILAGKIHYIRGQKIMLDRDLAELYGVLTKNLNKAVKRNRERFPDDFMFQLTVEENEILRFQFGTLGWGEYSKFVPYAFTEKGVAMLSSVLRSPQAIAVNIQIIRVFEKMRELLLANKDILLKLENLEKELLKQNEHSKKHDQQIQLIFDYLKKLLNPAIPPPRKVVGFKTNQEEK